MGWSERFASLASNADMTVGIIGLGYVGLPTAIGFHDAGFTVWGVDVSQRTVDMVKAGNNPTGNRPADNKSADNRPADSTPRSSKAPKKNQKWIRRKPPEKALGSNPEEKANSKETYKERREWRERETKREVAEQNFQIARYNLRNSATSCHEAWSCGWR